MKQIPKLYDYQDYGVELLLKHPRYCLFWEVGTGKTFTVVSALNRLAPGKVLICSPKRVQEDMWKTLGVPINHDVTYINYEMLPRTKYFPKFDYIVLDEVHRIKGSNTKCGKIITKLSHSAIVVWGLTGTPVANSYLDTFRILQHMGIKEFMYPESAFIARYYMTYSIPVDTRWGKKNIQKPVAVRDMFKDELMEMFGRYCNSVQMADVHNLPPRTDERIFVDGMKTEEYELAEQGIIKLDDTYSVVARLEACNKAHQAANGFMYYRDLATEKLHARRITENNAKLDKLCEMLDARRGKKTIVVFKFKYDKAVIIKALNRMGISATDDDHEKDTHDVLLRQISCSEGLNFQHYTDTMIFYSYDYSHLSYEQMSGRIYRVGQTQPTHFYVLVARGTIEEAIYNSVRLKHSLDEYLKSVTKRVKEKV